MLVEIPDNIFTELKKEAQGIIHGAIYLQIHFRDSKVMYFKTCREKSNSVAPSLTKSVGDQVIARNSSDNHSGMRRIVKK